MNLKRYVFISQHCASLMLFTSFFSLLQKTPELKHHHELNHLHTPSSLPNSSVANKYPRRSHTTKSSALQVGSADKTFNPMSDHTYQAFSLHVPDGNLEASYVCSDLSRVAVFIRLLRMLFDKKKVGK